MQDFRKLNVWKKSHDVVLKIYGVTAKFPPAEMYGLTSQMRRSSGSIAMNIAEGCGRGGDTDFARFLAMAMGSASELEYQILLAKDLNFVKDPDYNLLSSDVIEVKRMLSSLIQKLRADS